jgi:hypothetical protein
MTTIYAIHAPEADRLDDVIEQMKALGAPTIEVVDCGDHYMALEGSHRLAAARELGIAPILVVHEQEDIIDIRRFDWSEEMTFADDNYSAGEIAGELFSPTQAVSYFFDDAD